MRGLVRTTGITLLVASIAVFTLQVFVLSSAEDSAKNIVIGSCTGLGLALILLTLPKSSASTRGETLQVMFSVFFTFGTLGPLIMMVVTGGEANFLVGIAGVCVSGGLSLLWATAFTRRVFWLIPIAILVSSVGPPFLFRTMYDLGGFQNFFDHSLRTRLGVLGIESLICLVLGYILMIRFVSRVEREAARSEAELVTASRIHAQLVPAIQRTVGPWRVRAVSVPSSTMGGDLVDLIEREDGGADLVVADVTGHGVRAGVVMAVVKGVVWAELARHGSLEDAARRINRMLVGLLDTGTFVTAAVVRLPADSGDRTAAVLVAGHPPPIVRKAGSEPERVAPHGLPWGIEADEVYGVHRVSLEHGAVIAMYSDGLTEAAPAAGGMLGIEGVESVVMTTPDPDRLLDAMLDRASRHAGGLMDDDRSAAAVWLGDDKA